MIRRRKKAKKVGFIKRVRKEALAGCLGVFLMTVTTGFTDKDVQNVTVEVDGRVVEMHTAEFSPENIFNHLGVKLNEKDDYIVIKDEGGAKIRVLRAKPVSVRIEDSGASYYKTTITNVRDFLKSEGYDMTKYEANVGLDSAITEGLEIVLEAKEAKIARLKAEEEARQAAEQKVETARGAETYGDTMVMEASAYLPGDGNGDGITAIGIPATYGVAAVDPRVIPLGTRLYIEGYGEAIAADTGGAIRGAKIDLCMESYDEAMSFGRRNVTVYILR